MKPSDKNIKKLNKLGFNPDDSNELEHWWSLKCGWGFVLDCMPSFSRLRERLRISVKQEDCPCWSKEMKKAYKLLSIQNKKDHV
jgi:hypothetical protein